MPTVSLYRNIYSTSNGATVDLDIVLRGIKRGKWSKGVNAYRESVRKNGKESEVSKGLKKALPYFTTSGTFTTRSDEGLIEHSGFVAVDIDGVDNPIDRDTALLTLRADPYTYSAFVSCSGNGICVIVKIVPEEHTEVFRDLEAYYLSAYGIEIDHLADVSRPRFVSYDQECGIHPESKVFEVACEASPSITYEAKEYWSDEEQLDFAVKCTEKHYQFVEQYRHKYIFLLANIANRLGVSESRLTSFVNINYPHFRQHPTNAIKWSYKNNSNEFGIWKKEKRVSAKGISTPGPHPASQPATQEDFEQIILNRQADWKNPIPEPEAVIGVKGGTLSTAGNITTISGYSKSGKSGVMNALIAGSMTIDGDIVDTLGFDVMRNKAGHALLSIDTEQSRYNFDRNYRGVVHRAGRDTPPEWYQALWLKGLEPQKILEFTWLSADHYAQKFGGVYGFVIDGIGDYLKSVNDEAESNFIVDEFMRLAEAYNCPVITVLHLNPGSDKQRGHIGSQLRRKSETVLKVEKDQDTEASRITYPLLRNAGLLPEICFMYNQIKGYHTLIRFEDNQNREKKKHAQLKNIADSVLSIEKERHMDDLIQAIRADQLVTEARATSIIKQMRNAGVIKQTQINYYAKDDYVPF